MPQYWQKNESARSDYSVHFAQVSGVLFVALPFQSYYSRQDDMAAMVSNPKRGIWNAMVLKGFPDGKTILFADASFSQQDEAFYWAAGEMLAMQFGLNNLKHDETMKDLALL